MGLERTVVRRGLENGSGSVTGRVLMSGGLFLGLCLDSRWVRLNRVSAIRFLVHIHIVF